MHPDHPEHSLPPALSGRRFGVDTTAGRIACYAAGPPGPANDPHPMVMLHSVNAAASAYEVRPLYEHYARTRPVHAPELPGFGSSQREDRVYSPRVMTDALHAAVDFARARHDGRPVDALAISLSCEFLARAAVERPDAFRSLALVSPTALDGKDPRHGPPGTTAGKPRLLAALQWPPLSEALFRALTARPVVRHFLRKTFGTRQIPEDLLEYDLLAAHCPGARHAPLYFVSGHLFSRDAGTLYESLRHPVWMCHGVRGDFQDYRGKRRLDARPNWTIRVFRSGALPHFEVAKEFVASYDRFLSGVHALAPSGRSRPPPGADQNRSSGAR